MEILVSAAALVAIIIGMSMGMNGGASTSLKRMLCAWFAILVALRGLFPAARAASGLETVPLGMLAGITFAVLFLLAWWIAGHLCETYFETFASVEPSLIDRLLGAVFGGVTGASVAAALLLIAALLGPLLPTGYHREKLPLGADAFLPDAYRFVETRIAMLPTGDPGRTRLPDLSEAGTGDPAKFWP